MRYLHELKKVGPSLEGCSHRNRNARYGGDRYGGQQDSRQAKRQSLEFHLAQRLAVKAGVVTGRSGSRERRCWLD